MGLEIQIEIETIIWIDHNGLEEEIASYYITAIRPPNPGILISRNHILILSTFGNIGMIKIFPHYRYNGYI